MTLSATQLAQMRSRQATYMGDTGQVGTHSEGSEDAFGRVPGSYAYGSAISCGFEWEGSNERHSDVMTQANADAMVRVARATSIAVNDRFKLTHRYGDNITDIVFEVVGIARRGPTATLVLLRKVES